MITTEQVPTMNPVFRFQWEQAQQAYVLLYPEGMVRLNGSAGEILGCCDGSRPVAVIIEELQSRFPDAGDLSEDILDFLGEAHEKQWIHFN